MSTVAPSTVPARTRNRLGILALVLALVVALAPVFGWLITGVVGAVQSSSPGDAGYLAIIGGLLVFLGLVSLLSPLAAAAVVIGVVSLFRPGRKTPGVVAIVIGAFGCLGFFGLGTVLAEIVPGM